MGTNCRLEGFIPQAMANPRPNASGNWFTNLATASATAVGSPVALMFALATILAWLVTGPLFHYSNSWQLVVNSWTNIVTFLVVFLIQNSQNRDSRAINLKLDELIRSTQHARDDMIDIERLSDQELEKLGKRYERIRLEREQRRTRRDDQRR